MKAGSVPSYASLPQDDVPSVEAIAVDTPTSLSDAFYRQQHRGGTSPGANNNDIVAIFERNDDILTQRIDIRKEKSKRGVAIFCLLPLIIYLCSDTWQWHWAWICAYYFFWLVVLDQARKTSEHCKTLLAHTRIAVTNQAVRIDTGDLLTVWIPLERIHAVCKAPNAFDKVQDSVEIVVLENEVSRAVQKLLPGPTRKRKAPHLGVVFPVAPTGNVHIAGLCDPDGFISLIQSMIRRPPPSAPPATAIV